MFAGRSAWRRWGRLCRAKCGRDARAPGWVSPATFLLQAPSHPRPFPCTNRSGQVQAPGSREPLGDLSTPLLRVPRWRSYGGAPREPVGPGRNHPSNQPAVLEAPFPETTHRHRRYKSPGQVPQLNRVEPGPDSRQPEQAQSRQVPVHPRVGSRDIFVAMVLEIGKVQGKGGLNLDEVPG